MNNCKNHDNWCEHEKRGCTGCFYNKEKSLKNINKKYEFIMVNKEYIEKLIIENEELRKKVGEQ